VLPDGTKLAKILEIDGYDKIKGLFERCDTTWLPPRDVVSVV
jgi:hypothetical protein